jgi:hypothetical protein
MEIGNVYVMGCVLGSPLFANPPYEPSPSARAFIQHARVFFKRASSIFEALNAKMLTFAEQG